MGAVLSRTADRNEWTVYATLAGFTPRVEVYAHLNSCRVKETPSDENRRMMLSAILILS